MGRSERCAWLLVVVMLAGGACGEDSSTDAGGDVDVSGDGGAEVEADAVDAADELEESDAVEEGDGATDTVEETEDDAADGPEDWSGDDDGGPTGICAELAAGWDPESVTLEEQVVDELNAARAAGADCHSEGVFAATGPVVMEPHLQCAARAHSRYMAAAETISFDSPGGLLGDDIWSAVTATGYPGTMLDADLGTGLATAAELVSMLLSSDGDCANIMNPEATQLGVGHASAPTGMFSHTWTLVEGRE